MTHASGLRVPGPLGDRLILRALYESKGRRARGERRGDFARQRCDCRGRAASTPRPRAAAHSPCTEQLVAAGRIPARLPSVLVFNTGSGASYRF